MILFVEFILIIQSYIHEFLIAIRTEHLANTTTNMLVDSPMHSVKVIFFLILSFAIKLRLQLKCEELVVFVQIFYNVAATRYHGQRVYSQSALSSSPHPLLSVHRLQSHVRQHSL